MNDFEDYDADFRAWFARAAATFAAEHPGLPPYPVGSFDGCSGVPDCARWACAFHDLRYHYGATRAERLLADRTLREDIVAMGRYDPAWRWDWWLRGWLVYVGVRCFGWLWFGRACGIGPLSRKPA